MIAKIIRDISRIVTGGKATPTFHPLPQLAPLQASQMAMERWHQNQGIVSDREVEELGLFKTASDKAAKNAQRAEGYIAAISKNEIAIAKSFEKARQAAEQSQITQGQIHTVGWNKSRQLIQTATDAIAAAGGEL